MTKRILYTYLGTNGTITTPIHLEGIYSIAKYQLIADNKKRLTKDGKNLVSQVSIPLEEIDDWYEIDFVEDVLDEKLK